jgi:hypothetical protein
VASLPRLIIDDTLKGNLDILDLDPSGSQLVDQWRWSYRGRYETNCQWPDIDPGPTYTCSWMSIHGNGLALEWAYETRTRSNEPHLFDRDELYLLDPIHSKAHLRRIALSHPGQPFWAAEQAELGLEGIAPFLGNGVENLHLAPRQDRLWMASGLQSFNQGYVPLLDTLHLGGWVLDPLYGDQDLLIEDPSDPDHHFIPVADSFAPSPALILREVVNQQVVNSITVLTGYQDDSLKAATFDPALGLIYLAIGDTVHVVSATTPDASDRDGDGLPNDYELAHGLDPDDPWDARADVDGDGWNFTDEYRAGTDPYAPDSDGDGIGDPSDPLPRHADPCTDFIHEGVLANVAIAGSFSCQIPGPLVIEGSVTVLPTANADIRAYRVQLSPGFRALRGGVLRLRQ